MANYLVTGGCGFIGSHLCEALLRDGHVVRVLDDLSSGRLDNLAQGARLLHGSVIDAGAVREAVVGIDGCFHLAAIASVERGMQDWLGTHRVNLGGAVTLLEAIARLAEPGRVTFVYASSAAVYGDCVELPIGEAAATRPLSAYGADKLGCELHARVATRVHGIPTAGLRFFNVYGPRQDPHSPYSGVISIFADRIARGVPVDVFGDGRQTRDFVCVTDVIAALLAAMRRRLPEAPVLNVCSGVATTVIDLAGVIAGLLDKIPALNFRPGRVGEIRHSRGAPGLAATRLALAAPRELRSGLRELLIGHTAREQPVASRGSA